MKRLSDIPIYLMEDNARTAQEFGRYMARARQLSGDYALFSKTEGASLLPPT